MDNIRNQYLRDLKSRQMSTRQRAVALYFIDKVCVKPLISISSCLHRSAKNESKLFVSEVTYRSICCVFLLLFIFDQEILVKEQLEVNPVFLSVVGNSLAGPESW